MALSVEPRTASGRQPREGSGMRHGRWDERGTPVWPMQRFLSPAKRKSIRSTSPVATRAAYSVMSLRTAAVFSGDQHEGAAMSAGTQCEALAGPFHPGVWQRASRHGAALVQPLVGERLGDRHAVISYTLVKVLGDAKVDTTAQVSLAARARRTAPQVVPRPRCRRPKKVESPHARRAGSFVDVGNSPGESEPVLEAADSTLGHIIAFVASSSVIKSTKSFPGPRRHGAGCPLGQLQSRSARR
jgi:hypothetical protein